MAVYGNSKDIEEDILYLSKITSKIIFITENKDFKFKNKNLNNNNIQILDNTTITEAKGDSLKGLETLLITNNLTKEKQELNIDGFFYINNYENNMLLLQDKISTTKNGLVITSDNSFMTNIDGVFVAGDIKEGSTKQIVTACASGAEVVYEVKKWISKN
ncbi:MAG: NAD(P)/FAD-dependent oxidoreductase [Bdellovibrionota bacterium]